jgi:hypothetical protein
MDSSKRWGPKGVLNGEEEFQNLPKDTKRMLETIICRSFENKRFSRGQLKRFASALIATIRKSDVNEG